MFLPTSPSPPRGTIRSASLIGGEYRSLKQPRNEADSPRAMPFTVSLGTSAATFALFAAAYMLAVALQRSEDESLPEPLEGERFSLAAPVHVAAILVAGPWAAALVALLGTWTVRPFRNDGLRTLVARSVGLAAAALGPGYVFQLSGGVAGTVRLPEDVLPVVLAGFVYWTVNPDFLVGTAEIGLGL